MQVNWAFGCTLAAVLAWEASRVCPLSTQQTGDFDTQSRFIVGHASQTLAWH